MEKKLFVLSDVHGCYTEMMKALKESGFSRDDETHFLLCCGDYFDRGKENKKVLEFFESLERKILLRGNHEDVFSEVLKKGTLLPHNYKNGSIATITEFFGKGSVDTADGTVDFSCNSRDAVRLINFIEGLDNYYETRDYVFTHGWLPVAYKDGKATIKDNWRAATEDEWFCAHKIKWVDMYENCNRVAGKTIICGHFPTTFAAEFDFGRDKNDCSTFYGKGVIAIDAATNESKKVNVLVLQEKD